MPRQLLNPSGRHRYHELVLFGASVLLGISYLSTVPAPQSLTALVPGWLVALWAIGLLASGSLGLIAAAWRGSILVALELERSALLISTGALLLIGGTSFVATGLRALFGGLIIASWAVANILRALQIRRDLHTPTAGEREDL